MERETFTERGKALKGIKRKKREMKKSIKSNQEERGRDEGKH